MRLGQQSVAERSLLSQRFHVNRRHLVARGDDTGIQISIQVEQGEAPVVVSEIKQWILREIIKKREPEDIFRDNANDPNMFCVIYLQELGKELRYTLTDLDSTEVARQVTLRVSIEQFIGYIDTYKRYCNFCLKCDENARTLALWKNIQCLRGYIFLHLHIFRTLRFFKRSNLRNIFMTYGNLRRHYGIVYWNFQRFVNLSKFMDSFLKFVNLSWNSWNTF